MRLRSIKALSLKSTKKERICVLMTKDRQPKKKHKTNSKTMNILPDDVLDDFIKDIEQKNRIDRSTDKKKAKKKKKK